MSSKKKCNDMCMRMKILVNIYYYCYYYYIIDMYCYKKFSLVSISLYMKMGLGGYFRAVLSNLNLLGCGY